MQQVLDTLFKLIPELSPKLRVVAKLILDKPNAVATMSILLRELFTMVLLIVTLPF